MALDRQAHQNAQAAGVREALIALARQIEMRHPGIVDAAISDVNAAFDAMPAPGPEVSEVRAIMRQAAAETLNGAKT